MRKVLHLFILNTDGDELYIPVSIASLSVFFNGSFSTDSINFDSKFYYSTKQGRPSEIGLECQHTIKSHGWELFKNHKHDWLTLILLVSHERQHSTSMGDSSVFSFAAIFHFPSVLYLKKRCL